MTNRLRSPLWLGILCGVFAIQSSLAQSQEIERRNNLTAVIEKTKDAIVNLRTNRVIPARIDESEGGRVKGLGTGVIVDPRGYVVTNYHVVEKVDEIQAILADGSEYPVEEIGSDKQKDVAVLKISAKRTFKYLPLWGAGSAILGESVFAIGNPFGLENSVSLGIVSAVNRELKLPNNEMCRGLIQTDASINPGNSGGPLLTINGDLLGINVAIRKDAHRIGFALPTDEVRKIVEKIMGTPAVLMANQGIMLRGLADERDLDRVSRKLNGPVTVSNVEPGSMAQKIGFIQGDELVSVGDQEVRTRFDLDRVFWGRNPGDKIAVMVKRNGKDVKILEIALPPKKTPKDMTDSEVIWQVFGIQVRKVAAENVRPIHSSLNGGLLILQIMKDSPADKAGFSVGDILVGLHDYEMIEPNNIRFVMQWDQLSQNQPIKYHMIRDGAMKTGSISMPSIPRN